MSGPVGGVFNNLQGEMSRRDEYSMFITDKQRQRILKKLFPQAKVIACVRHVQWIIESINQLICRNTLRTSSIFKYQPGGTVYSRSEGLANGDGMVGFAYDAL